MAAETRTQRPKIAVIGTGGTFAMEGRHRFDWAEYSESGIVHPISSLIEQMGHLALDVDLVPVTFRALGSTAISPADWLELSHLIQSTVTADPQISGVVITHGTATLEETAWFLDLTLDVRVGVVVTGAQRPANTSGSDVQANLRAALAVAASTQARHSGVLVVVDNQVFSARDVTKNSSFELAAFESPVFGPLASVNANADVLWRRLPARAGAPAPMNLSGIEKLPNVGISLSYAGSDGSAIRGLLDGGCEAIVVAGLPPGRPAQGEMEALREARQQGVLVIMATRALRGLVPEQAFIEREGWLAGGDLAPHKLRILMMLVLTQTRNIHDIQRWITHA